MKSRDFVSAHWNHCVIRKALILLYQHGDSVVECLTRDPRVVGSRLTEDSLALHCVLDLLLSTGSTKEDRDRHD